VRIQATATVAVASWGRRDHWDPRPRRTEMADMAYVLLLLGGFALLALTLRGLQRL
jgi:hypothetical protein